MARKKKRAQVEWTRRVDELHGFRIQAANGEIVHGDHQGYASKRGSVGGLYALQRAVNEAVTRYEEERAC